MMVGVSVALVTLLAQASGTSMRTIDKGLHSNVDSARQVVARTPAEWSALWKTHNFDRPVPAVDFAREMVIGVFMGSRPTSGFNVEIVAAAEQGRALVVSYRETVPPPDAITAQVLTSPYHLVAVPKVAGEVRFESQK